MPHQAIIKIKDLYKSYKTPTNESYDVLKGINLEIDSTDFCMIIGPSGSGKSTLLNHIVGLEAPTEGEIWIRGINICALSPEDRATFRAKKFGMVYQTPYWVKSLNVWENVALPLLIDGVKDRDAKRVALDSLEEINMAQFANKSPMVLSGGEQQRVGLARSLVNNPWILIADEPTGNLDTHSADTVMEILQSLNVHSKRTVIMVTHNLSYMNMATKEVTIKDGEIVSSGIEAVRQQIREELKGVL